MYSIFMRVYMDKYMGACIYGAQSAASLIVENRGRW